MKKATFKHPLTGLMLLFVFSLITFRATAQEATAHWEYDLDKSAVVSGNITATPTKTVSGTFLSRNSLKFNIAEGEEVDPKIYFQNSLSPKPGYSLIVNEISFEVKASIYYNELELRYSFSSDSKVFETIDDVYYYTDSTYFNFSDLNIMVPEGATAYFTFYPKYAFSQQEMGEMFYMTFKGHTEMQPVTLTYGKENWCTDEMIAEAEITGSGEGTFSSSPGLDLDPTSGSIDLSTSLPGSYTVSYSSSGEVLATSDITINPTPECFISGTDQQICPSTTYTFSAPEGMAEYTWSVTGNASFKAENKSREVIVETGTSCESSFNLTLTVIDSNGCTNTCNNEILIKEKDAVKLSVPEKYTAGPCNTQETINSAFSAWLEQATFEGGCNTVLTTSPANEQLVPPDACGGSITVTWTATSECGSVVEETSTFTVPDSPGITLTVPEDLTIGSSCLAQAVIDQAFAQWLAGAVTEGGCNTLLTSIPASDELTTPDACGGTVMVTWTATDGCDEVIKSASFTVPKPTPPVSEYEFVIGFPDKTCTNIPVQIPVDFVTTAVGDMGYDGVRFKIEATGPGDLFFKTTDSNGDLNMFTNTGYWNPENGFNIPADYEQTTYWETEFTVPGTYTIIISMVNAVDDDIIGNISKTITIMANLLPTAPVYDEVLNTHTYDGTVKTAVITTGLNEEVKWYTSESGTELSEVPAASFAGTYTAWAEIKNAITGCVSNTRTEIKLIIEKKELSITANNRLKPNGTNIDFDGSEFTCEGLCSEYDEIYSVSVSCEGISAGAEFGTYEITINEATGTGLNNYNISYLPGTLTVNGISCESFQTYIGPKYKAVNVGIRFEYLTIDQISDITVELFNSKGDVIAANRAVMEKITGVGTLISPFLINSNDFSVPEWIVLNDNFLSYEDKPTSAKIKVTDTTGIYYEADNRVLDETISSWANLFEISPALLSGTKSICAGELTDLFVNLTGQAPWTFTWTDGINDYTVSDTYESPHLIKVSPTVTTTYSLTGLVTDGAGSTGIGTGEAKIYVGPKTILPEILACPNTTIEVPISVKSFSDVRDISLTLKYDSGVMSFAGFSNGDIPFEEGEILVNDAPYGENFHLLRISRISGSENLPALADDAILLWLKFNYTNGFSELEWIDYPDNSWCSYSYMNVMDETGFETEEFCDSPSGSYYINGYVSVNPEPDVHISINGTIAAATDPLYYCSDENIEVKLQVSDWQAPFFLTWTVNNGEEQSAILENGEDLFNERLTTGQHILQLTSLTDANGCTLSQETLNDYAFTITINPQPIVTVTSTDATCFGSASGFITMEPFDEERTFQYTLEPGGFVSEEQVGTYVFSDLEAGTYTWTMTDVYTSCVSSGITVVNEPDIISLSGTIRYYNTLNTPLGDVTLTLTDPGTGTALATTTTNPTGEYIFDQVCPGNYNIEITNSQQMQSINSTDAGQVNAWNVAQLGNTWPSIEKVRFLAGDVTGDNYVDSGDAAMIQNYFLTLGLEVNFDENWEFWKINDQVSVQPQTDNTIQIEIISGNGDVVQDFYGLISGDFNRSFTPPADYLKSASIKSGYAVQESVTLLRGDDHIAEANEIIDLPVRALSDMQLGAISLMLEYPAEHLEVLDVYLKENMKHTAGFNTVGNMLIIGWNSTNSVSVESGETLLTIRLKMKGAEYKSPAYFSLAPNPLNELADVNMMTIDNVTLIMDGLILKGSVTGTEVIGQQNVFNLESYPNPFQEHLTLTYTLPENGYVNLEITGISGNKIRILSDQYETAGKHQIKSGNFNLVPGIYHVSLRLTDVHGISHVRTVRVVKK